MKTTLALALTALSIGLTACEHLPKPGTRSVLSLRGKEGTIGSLFVWSNDVNAGMITKDGDVCMQRAMTVRSSSAQGEATVPASIVSASAALEAAAAQGQDQAAIALSGAISQAAAALSTTTERTAFLDIGMFYLCQLHANGAVSDHQAVVLAAQLIRDSALIVPVAGYLPYASAPALPGAIRTPLPTNSTRPEPEAEAKPETAAVTPTEALTEAAENPTAEGAVPAKTSEPDER